MAMTEPLDLFADPVDRPVQATPIPMMRKEQRDEIRSLFASLGLATAREQFELVSVLIGVHLNSVTELTATNASALIHRLRERVDSRSKAKSSTGNSWVDREEDTWIDRL